MASKPFKITSPTDAGIVRQPDGKFARPAPLPPEVRSKAAAEKKALQEVVEEVRVRLGSPVPPTPDAGPINDGNKKPMRVS